MKPKKQASASQQPEASAAKAGGNQLYQGVLEIKLGVDPITRQPVIERRPAPWSWEEVALEPHQLDSIKSPCCHTIMQIPPFQPFHGICPTCGKVWAMQVQVPKEPFIQTPGAPM